jgi:DNA primase
MPGVDFALLRARVALSDVLGLIGFIPCETSGAQVRGPCPVHHSASPSSRSFSANLNLHIYRCFKCGSAGNQLDLYAAVTGLSLFDSAIALCEQLHHEVPWVLKESSPRSQPADRPAPVLGSGYKSGGQVGSIPHRP